MLAVLKNEGEYISVRPAQLVSWIIGQYFLRYFERDKDLIIKEYFNSKEYLKTIIKSVDTTADLSSVLKETLSKISEGKKKRHKRQA